MLDTLMVRLDCLLVIWFSASIFERFFFSLLLSVVLKSPSLLTLPKKFSFVFNIFVKSCFFLFLRVYLNELNAQ